MRQRPAALSILGLSLIFLPPLAGPASAQAMATHACVASVPVVAASAEVVPMSRPPSAVDMPALRVHRTRFGRLDICDGERSIARVGWLGGGLSELTAGNPAAERLATRFRAQRRTGLILSTLAVVGAGVVFQRVTDVRQDPLALGDPESYVLMGAMGALIGGMVQIDASRRTMDGLAETLPGSVW